MAVENIPALKHFERMIIGFYQRRASIATNHQFGLLYDSLSRLLLLVRRIPVASQCALNQRAHLRPHILSQRPVDGGIVADGLNQLAGYLA